MCAVHDQLNSFNPPLTSSSIFSLLLQRLSLSSVLSETPPVRSQTLSPLHLVPSILSTTYLSSHSRTKCCHWIYGWVCADLHLSLLIGLDHRSRWSPRPGFGPPSFDLLLFTVKLCCLHHQNPRVVELQVLLHTAEYYSLLTFSFSFSSFHLKLPSFSFFFFLFSFLLLVPPASSPFFFLYILSTCGLSYLSVVWKAYPRLATLTTVTHLP